MANSGISGVDFRLAGGKLAFRASLKDSSGAKVTTGTTSLRLYELQDDGTLLTYDWNDNTFKATTVTTEALALTHRAANNGATSTGLWTAVLSTLTGFTPGAIYVAQVTNTGASPESQEREFQFSGSIDCLIQHAGKSQAGTANTITLASSAPATAQFYRGCIVLIVAGTGAGQGARAITDYSPNGSSRVATLGRNWVTQPDNTSVYIVLNLSVPKVDDSLAVIVPDTQKVDVNTIKQRAAQDVGLGNTAYFGTVAFPTTWPANWSWGTSTLTTSDIDARITAAGLATAANLAIVAGYLDTEVAAILEDTGTTLPASVAALDTLIDAVKAKTDLLGTASVAISYSFSVNGALSQTLYCDATDIDDLYGVANANKWADLDGDADADKIAARKLRAIASASAYIESRLRGGRYAIPLAGVDVTVVNIAAALAGGWLRDARQVTDDDESGNVASKLAKRAEKMLDAIQAGTLRLTCTLASSRPAGTPIVR